MKEKWKKTLLDGCIVFLMTGVICAGAYAMTGIYPGSARSILASDGFSQYANFHASFNRMLHGQQSPLYSWSGSIGLNYWSLSAYYLNGLFTFLVGLFSNDCIPDTLYFLTLIKLGSCAVAFWLYASHTFRLSRKQTIAFSILYALMGFAVAYSEVIMWLDGLFYLPLIIWGIDRVLQQKRPAVLFFSYLLLFLSSFYLGFMIGVFSFLYFCIQLFLRRSFKGAGMYWITALLAGGASMVTILPTLIDLRSNGESLTRFSHFWTPDMGPWDLVAKNMVGVYDTSKFQSMPFIYVGLVPLLLCLLFFFSRKIDGRSKAAYGGLFLLLIASFYLYPLNLFWHGFHWPNMFLFRFSFLFSFLVLLTACQLAEKLDQSDGKALLTVTAGLAVLFGLFLWLSNKKRYDVVQGQAIVWTFAFLAGYFLLFWLMWKRGKQSWALWLLVGLMVGESSVNTYAMMQGINRDWGYIDRSLYENGRKDIAALVKKTEQPTFVRTENLDPISINDSFNFGYHGVSMFSSIRNRRSSQYLNRLGFRSLNTNLLVSYSNNTLLMDDLFGVKYNLAKQPIQKFGYKEIAKQGEYHLYENQWAFPLGIWTDAGIHYGNHNQSQTDLINYLSEDEEPLFVYRNPVIIGKDHALVKKMDDQSLTITETEVGKNKTVTWMVTVPAQTQAYFSLVPTDFNAVSGMNISYKANGMERVSSFPNTGQYYNLGAFDQPQEVTVSVLFPRGSKEKPNVSLYQPQVVCMDLNQYQKKAAAIQKKGVDFVVKGRKATATVNPSKKQTLLTTIPYEKGWQATIDGKKVPIKPLRGALITLEVPKGRHTIELRYFPQGFIPGLCLWISCLLVFIGYDAWWRRKNKMVAPINEIETSGGNDR